jgi:hypothetical protein
VAGSLSVGRGVFPPATFVIFSWVASGRSSTGIPMREGARPEPLRDSAITPGLSTKNAENRSSSVAAPS